VTLDTYVRAETDGYLVENAPNGIGVFEHRRDPVAIDQQSVIRMNRDTLYSSIVLDLTEPATITLPETGGRFMSALVIDQDHYVDGVHYAPATITLTQEAMGTRFVAVFLRTFADPNDPDDIAAAHAAQDAVTVAQADVGVFELPDWDQEDRIAIRQRLNALAPYQSALPAFGTADQVDPVAHLVGTAVGWGANPREAAEYLFGGVPKNDGTTAYELTVSDVPVDGFWSITVYNTKGFMEKNDLGVNALNSVTAKAGPDGAHTIQFGGCAPTVANCIPVMDGWNYTIRLYRPRAEVQNGTWVAPVPAPVK
jgi:hypothetical protein